MMPHHPTRRIFSFLLATLLMVAGGLHASTALTADEIAYLKSVETITFVSQTSYAPFEFVDRAGERKGMCLDLVHWMSAELGFRANFVDMPLQEAQDAVLAGKADVLTSLFHSQRRDGKFDFTDMIFEVPASIFVRAERPDIQGLDDLRGRRVAMQRGDYAAEFLESRGIDVEVVSVASFAEATDAVVDGRADAVVGDEQIVLFHLYSQGLEARLKIVGTPLFVGRNCMAVANGDAVLAGILNKGIHIARQQGVIDRIERTWLGRPIAPAPSLLLENATRLAVFSALALVALLAVLVWNRQLDKVVRARTSELAETNQRLELALDGASLSLWDWDLMTNKVTRDSRLERMLGYAPGTFSNASEEEWRALTHPEDDPAVNHALLECISAENAELSCQLRLRAADGGWKWSEARGRVVERDASGKPTRMIGTHLDITENKRAEAGLRRSERHYRLLLENLNAAVLVHGADDRPVYCNPKAEELLGISEERLLAGDAMEGVFHAENHEPIPREQFPSTRVIGGTPIQNAVYSIRRRGEEKAGGWIMLSGYAEQDREGALVRVVLTFVDIGEQRRAAAERQKLDAHMQHLAKLESLSVLAGGIAHDFNNLLMGILGSAGLALHDLPRDSPARESLELIEKTAQRAAELTRQMLAYSGKGRFVVVPINVSRLVREMSHIMETIVNRRAHLRLDCPEDTPNVEADQTQLRQIVMNLIINAADAVKPTDGVIAIRTGAMDATREYLAETWLDDNLRPGRYTFVEVSDNGVGMPPHICARIFDPFFTTKQAGHGLGLAAALGIIRGHKGFIEVSSEPGKGTTFRFGFPCVEAPEYTPPGAVESPDAWKPQGTILLVDDDETVVIVASRILARLGFQVVVARDGAQGVELFRQRHPEIGAVLLDMNMPHLTGDEAFRQMRLINRDVPVVLMSGFTEQDATSHFVGKGLAAFIQKPFRPAELAETLRTVLGQRSP